VKLLDNQENRNLKSNSPNADECGSAKVKFFTFTEFKSIGNKSIKKQTEGNKLDVIWNSKIRIIT